MSWEMGFSAGRLRCLGGILHMLLDFANIACLLPGLAGRGCVKIGIFKTSLNLNRSLDIGEIARLCHAACFWPSRRRSGLRRGVARDTDAKRDGNWKHFRCLEIFMQSCSIHCRMEWVVSLSCKATGGTPEEGYLSCADAIRCMCLCP